jgi:hypothetical protein
MGFLSPHTGLGELAQAADAESQTPAQSARRKRLLRTQLCGIAANVLAMVSNAIRTPPLGGELRVATTRFGPDTHA